MPPNMAHISQALLPSGMAAPHRLQTATGVYRAR
jgi:hypothetical protein